eukprot:903966-Amphidinium_carterae.1
MGSKRVERKRCLTASMVWRWLLMRQLMMHQAEPTTAERAPLPGCEGDCASSSSVIHTSLSLHVLRRYCLSSQDDGRFPTAQKLDLSNFDPRR